MTSEVIAACIGILATLLGVIVGAVLNHFLEQSRNKTSLLLNKKLEVYSNILVKLNTVFQDEKENFTSDPNFTQNIRITIAKALSAGRLLAGEKLEGKLRDYYETALVFWEKNQDDGSMAKLVVEIEQLMREELGEKNLLN